MHDPDCMVGCASEEGQGGLAPDEAETIVRFAKQGFG